MRCAEKSDAAGGDPSPGEQREDGGDLFGGGRGEEEEVD